MKFWQLLLHVAPVRPAKAFAALWWHLTRRRVRAKNILKAAAADRPFLYRLWIRDVESRRTEPLGRRGGSSMLSVVILPGNTDAGGVERSLASLQRQSLRPCRIMIPVGSQPPSATDPEFLSLPVQPEDEGGCLAAALRTAAGGTLLVLRAGDLLAPSALACFEEALVAEVGVLVAYGDHDHLDTDGRRFKPWFKPDWDEEHFLAQDYVSTACAIPVAAGLEAFADASPPRNLFELLLKVAGGRSGSILHIPHIVAHRADRADFLPAAARAAAIGRQYGLKAEPGPFRSVRVRRELPMPPPLVTIIVPTKDKLDLIEPCIRSVLEKTRYPAYEIIIVDNGSTDPRCLAFFAEIEADARVRVLSAPIPYNFSALNNLAAREARGEFLCLLNNDTEVLEGEWLTEMMRHAVLPDVGAVGARLLYPDGSIQHAGVVVGMGDAAGHVYRFTPNADEGYFAQHHITRTVTAVTAACLLVATNKYLAVGGLDEQELAIAYNDVDLCLRLRATGLRNVYVASALLVHHESKSRIKDHASSQLDRYTRELTVFRTRWGIPGFVDPAFNPNLDRSSEWLVLGFD